jgi:hypothetical protein
LRDERERGGSEEKSLRGSGEREGVEDSAALCSPCFILRFYFFRLLQPATNKTNENPNRMKRELGKRGGEAGAEKRQKKRR